MNDRSLARGLVAAQFGALAGWAIAGPLLAPAFAGRLLQAAGIGLGAWAAAWMSLRLRRAFSVTPLPDAHERLVTDGPYRWLRHPMYTALLLVVLPASASGSVGSAIAGIALLAVLIVKYRFEDRLLAGRFPGEHAAWRSRTGGLLPFVG